MSLPSAKITYDYKALHEKLGIIIDFINENYNNISVGANYSEKNIVSVASK